LDQRNLPANKLYNYPSDGRGVNAYIIDTGVQASHPEFGNRVLPGFRALATTDCHGHGTHVAGTVGSQTYGVAKAVQIIPVQVLYCNGSGPTSTIIAGIDWVISNHADGVKAVANLSLGGTYNPLLNQAAQSLVNDGVVVTVAAGNNNADACDYSPGSAIGTISVGAIDSSDVRSYFSNYGACVDIFAPGSKILSTTIGSSSSYKSGTSMAAPHAAGVAAMIWSLHPTWTSTEVSAEVVASGTPNKVINPGPQSHNKILFISLTNREKVPSAPTQVKATSSAQGVQINWMKPSSSGSSQITEYEAFTDKDLKVCVWSSGPLRWVTNNLAPGTYSFRVTAINNAGTSVASSLSKVITITSDSGNNDVFSQPKVLNSLVNALTDSNVAATNELNEPRTYGTTYATKWFRFTPSNTSSITLDLSGSSFDTVLGVYTGDSFSQLSLIAKDNDSGDGSTSKLSFNATLGKSYRIQVGSYGDSTGSIRLNSSSSASCSFGDPSNDDILHAVRISVSGTQCMNTIHANPTDTAEPFDSSTNYSIWYVIQPTQNTSVTLDLSGSDFDTFLSVHRTSVLAPSDWSELTTVAYDDDSGDSSTSRISDLSVSLGFRYYIRVAGYRYASGKAKLTSSFGGRPAEPTNVTATAGDSSSTIVWDAPPSKGGLPITSYEVISNLGNYSCATSNLSCTISNMPYGEYSFTVSAMNAIDQGLASSPSNSVVVGNGNDDKANAQPLSQIIANGSNQYATAEADEPTHGNSGAGKSMWYSVSVSALTQITIETFESEFDTLLDVYSTDGSDGFVGLTKITTNDDDLNGADGSSRVSWTAFPSAHYLIAVDSYVDPNNPGPNVGIFSLRKTAEEITRPLKPQNVKVSIDDNEANVTWEKPLSGYSAITSYSVSAVGASLRCTSSVSRMRCKINGLLPGKSYSFKVRARNPLGYSSWTTATVPVVIPQIPHFNTDGQVTTSWALDRVNQQSKILDGLTTYRGHGEGVRVYIVDTGVSSAHQDLNGRVAETQNFADDDLRVDCNGHGTHVASLVAGTEFGIATLSTIIPVRVFDCSGSGYLSQVVSGLNWIVDDIHTRGTNAVVNMSLGGSSLDDSLELAVNQIIALGVPVVVAAGNSAADACTFTPAGIPDAITVAASEVNDVVASYSNYGSCVDLYAPGSEIVGADYSKDESYVALSGTSMASAFVTGYVAVLKQMFEKISIAQISKVIGKSARTDMLTGVPSGTPNKLLSTSSFQCSMISRAGPPSLDSSPSDCADLIVTAAMNNASVHTSVKLSMFGGSLQFARQATVSGAGCRIINSAVTSSRSGPCLVTARQQEWYGFKAQTSPSITVSFYPSLTRSQSAAALSIAAYAQLSVTSSSRLSLRAARASSKNCVVQGTRLIGLKVGSCSVTVTVTTKNGTVTSKKLTIPVS
jgi:subtilisin family serine protease